MEELSRPATAFFSAKRILTLGIDPSRLQLYTCQNKNQPWQVVLARYDAKYQRFSARVHHFSEWGLGSSLATKGHLLPSLKGFHSDRQTGAASVGYPIDAPAGAGGLTPGVSLGYSTAAANNLENDAGHRYSVQSDWAGGLGWGLSGVASISKNYNELNRYVLNLGGTSYNLVPGGDGWRTEPESFLRIQHYAGANEDAGTMDMYGWTVQSGDGSVYSFGYVASNLQDHCCSVPHWATWRTGYKWYLTQVQDRLGNRMNYFYEGELGHVGQECLRPDRYGNDWTIENVWYERATYLREVQWGGHSNGAPHTMRLWLGRENRPDTAILGSNERCSQAQAGSQRLRSLYVQVLRPVPAPNGLSNWHTLRLYTVDYQQMGHHSVANAIHFYGKDETTRFNRYSFDYAGIANSVVMTSANNGLGGKILWQYASYQIGCAPTGHGYGCADARWSRAVISETVTDGQGNSYLSVYGYSDPRGLPLKEGWEFLGYRLATSIVFAPNSTATIERRSQQQFFTWEQQGNSSYMDRDPKRGKESENLLWDGRTGAPLQETYTNWEVIARGQSKWIRQAEVTSKLYATRHTAGIPSVATSRTVYSYEPQLTGGKQYGNVTGVDEYYDGKLKRRTRTEYNPNDNPSVWVVNLPTRVRLLDEKNKCLSESRNVYDNANGLNGDHTSLPLSPLLLKSQKALNGCRDEQGNGYPAMNNLDWQESRYAYDTYGNPRILHLVGGGGAADQWISTKYDDLYHTFPISQTHSPSGLTERVLYYGVNGPELTDSAYSTFWGQAAEHCGVNGICTRQSYDVLGRLIYRWERVPENTPWAAGEPGSRQTNGQAQGLWAYFLPGQPGVTELTTYTEAEWRNPRCFGNFVRKHYDGLGQLVMETRPQQDWTAMSGPCGTVHHFSEVSTFYQYNSAGQQIRASVPVSTTDNWWQRPADWSQGYSQSNVDGLGRVLTTIAPNGERTQVNTTFYAEGEFFRAGFATAVIGIGRNGDPNKILKWTQTDWQGKLVNTRTYDWNVDKWVIGNSITLTHDLLGNLTQVQNQASGALSTIEYDPAGRKIKMTDADLGIWTYAYDRHSNLKRQTDARGWSTCLYYDGLGRLDGKNFRQHNNDCAENATLPFAWDYTYGDSNINTKRSWGQLTKVNNGDNSYSKELAYNELGLLVQESVAITGATPFVTQFDYDEYQRPVTTTYPGGEVVMVGGYNGIGLPVSLSSSLSGTLVSNASYDEARRLTQLHLPSGGNLIRSQVYGAWNTQSQ